MRNGEWKKKKWKWEERKNGSSKLVYTGTRRFWKSWGRKLTLKILSLAGATSYRATKGVGRGSKGGGGGGQCILSGGIFTEWEHELAANGMNVWWSESDRSEVAASPLFPILAVITSLVDQIKGSPRWKPRWKGKKMERISDWREKGGLGTMGWTRDSHSVAVFNRWKFDCFHIELFFFFSSLSLFPFFSYSPRSNRTKEGEEKRRKEKRNVRCLMRTVRYNSNEDSFQIAFRSPPPR